MAKHKHLTLRTSTPALCGGANEHDNVGVLTQNVFNSRPRVGANVG